MGANVGCCRRCWILVRPNDGRQSIVPESGKRFTQDEHLFNITPTYCRTYGTQNITVPRNR